MLAGVCLLSGLGWRVSSTVKSSSGAPAYQPVTALYLTGATIHRCAHQPDGDSNYGASVSLSWTAPAGTVDHYIVERSENVEGPFSFVANVTGATTKNDTSVTNLHAYLYRVRAVSSTGAISTPSNMALGTAISFQFSSLQGQVIHSQNFYDVRTAINLVRALGNVPAESWDRGTLTGLEVKADDVNEMRTALDAALTALSITPTAYAGSDPGCRRKRHAYQSDPYRTTANTVHPREQQQFRSARILIRQLRDLIH